MLEILSNSTVKKVHDFSHLPYTIDGQKTIFE